MSRTPVRMNERRPTLAGKAAATGLGALVAAGSLLGAPLAAQAHNYLVDSTPSAGEVLTALPDTFEITTNEALLESAGVGGFALEIKDANGLFYGDGCVTIDGPTMEALPALGEAGNYTVIWQVVSADGHTVSDTIDFSWAPADAAATVSEGSAEAPVCATAEGETGAEDTAPEESARNGDDASTTASDGFDDIAWILAAVALIGLSVAITLWVGKRRK
jgi:methionine-rich copper-binding protein CopC